MRQISFFLTTPQFLGGTKDVTRRLGWHTLHAGDHLIAIRKGQGLGKGGKVEKLGVIEVLDVRRERLGAITKDDVRREGFPDMSPEAFVKMYCQHHRGVGPDTNVTRIEFRQTKLKVT
jgi:hypothetical protein